MKLEDEPYPLVTRFRGHTIDIPEEDLLGNVWQIGESFQAEKERLLRLLPDPPEQYHWEFELQRREDIFDNMAHFRVDAILKANLQ